MSNLISPEILRSIELHEEWVISGNKKGVKLSLMDADLSGINLANRKLAEAVLPGTNFNKACLERVDLYRANLASASFVGADLSFADLTKAELDYASLVDAKLWGTRAFRASFYEADLRRANLQGADLRHASLYGANLEGAILKDTYLNGIHLEAVRLFCIDLLGASGLDSIYIKWIDVGPEGAPIRLEGEEARAWMLRRARGEVRDF
jgi:2-iminobutanoate/2-iminopropanoate deaminase